MSYVPPHLRKAKEDEWSTVKRNSKKKVEDKPKKNEYTEEFPSLNKEMESLPRLVETTPSKPTLSTLFKNSLNRKYKKKQRRIKPGWVLLTWNGVIDSLTPEERKAEDEAHEERMQQIRWDHMIREMDRRDNDRRENDHTYLWEAERTRAEFDKYEENEEDSEYYSETESDMYDEDNLEDELEYGN
jgi:hypothetical protein